MQRFVSAIETTAALSLLAIALVTAGNVVLRDLFAVQIPDWFDGSRLLMAIALFWGIAVTTWRVSHIRVDVLRERLGTRGRRALDLLNGAISFAFLAPMAWMVWSKVLSSGTQSTTDLRIPLIWFTGVAASGAAAAALLALLGVWRDARTRERPDGP